MTKKQLKERALMLFIFSFMKEGFRLLDLEPEKIDLSKLTDELDIKLISFYRQMKRLRPTYTQEKVINFFYKRIEKINDDIQQECQPLYMGLIGAWFYNRFKRTNEFTLSLKSNDIEKIINEYNKEFGISDCTIKKSIEIIESIYPDERGLIEFYRLTNRFPFYLLEPTHTAKDEEKLSE